ncbi:virulence factor TspB C-terminal domain-related protein [Moraxella lincolnii]|uniref:virulence factor TspB C-terminal domain-related protein n=1 Tax=Lwoffella lincolnii TaxID=90241 RepID=UPI0039843F3B
MKRILTLSLTALLAVQAQAGGAGGSWGEPTQPTKPAPTNDTGDYTGGGGKFGGTGAGGSWGDDYSGGGGKFGGSGVGGSWNSSSSSSSNSGASCTNDGWEFEYIVLEDRTSFNSLEQACRYVWSNSFLNKKGYKETRQSGGSSRGKYYRKIEVIDDWSARCYIHVGDRDYEYDNNIGGYGIRGWNVAKYYKGKVEICDPETMPPIPNFPMPPAPNNPTTPNTPSGGTGGGSDTGTGSSGNGGHTTNNNHTTNNYKWDITTNNHNTTNNTNHITNNHGISDDKINQLIIAIKNQNKNIDLSPIINAINTVNQSINNLSFEQVLDIEADITKIINAIKNNKYDDTQLKLKIDEVTKAINDKQIDLTPVTDRQDQTNIKLDDTNNKLNDANDKLNDANDKADEQTGLLVQIRDLLKPAPQTLQSDLSLSDEPIKAQIDPWQAIRGFDIHQNRINAQKQCPSSEHYSFDVFGTHFVMPLPIFCDALARLAPAFLFLAYMAGAFIIVKGTD